MNILIIYLLIMVGMGVFQRKFMYFPEQGMPPPAEYGLKAEVLSLTTEDGLKIEAWHTKPSKKEMPTVLYFHGNAVHLGARAEKFTAIIEAGYGLMAVSYRGYGNSEGKPTEQGLYIDARTAYQALKDTGVKDDEMIMYGESLGTGVATQLATEFTPQLLVLEAPFISVARRSQEIHPWIPAYYIVRDRYDSIAKIGANKAPVLILHGDKDLVIPIHHGRRLFEAANEPKWFKEFPDLGHTDHPLDEVISAIDEARAAGSSNP